MVYISLVIGDSTGKVARGPLDETLATEEHLQLLKVSTAIFQHGIKSSSQRSIFRLESWRPKGLRGAHRSPY